MKKFRKFLALLLSLSSLFCFCMLSVSAATPRYTILSRTYEDIWVEDDQIHFWAYAIPWEPTKITIKLKVQEKKNGKYTTLINASESGTADELEIQRTIPYGEDRYFKITIEYIVGPDNPIVTKYFYT